MVNKAEYKVKYNNQDITNEVKDDLGTIIYTDFGHGINNSLELVFSDKDKKWHKSWHPAIGDLLQGEISFPQLGTLPWGKFQIDEIEASSPPYEVVIHALNSYTSSSLYKKRSETYRNMTLKKLIEHIAIRHGLNIKTPTPSLPLSQMVQIDRTDPDFLKELASCYGYFFKLEGEELYFIPQDELFSAPIAEMLNEDNIISYSYNQTIHNTYKEVKIISHDPYNNKTIERIETDDNVKNSSTYTEYREVKSPDEGALIAKARLFEKNCQGRTLKVKLPGNPRLMAGVNIKVEGLGICNGSYYIESSKHIISSDDGYLTWLNLLDIEAFHA